MSNLKYSIGIDVSKKDFHCCLSVIDTEQFVKVKSTHKFTNSTSGFKLLIEWVRRNRKEDLQVFCVMEEQVYIMSNLPGIYITRIFQ